MITYFDIGELGWSLYLYGYLVNKPCSYLKECVVVSLPGREAIWRDLPSEMIYAPFDMGQKFDMAKQDGFGIHGVSDIELKNFFKSKMPRGWIIATEFTFSCNKHIRMNSKPIPLENSFGIRINKKKSRNQNKILVFPRKRTSEFHAYRNIKEEFYISLCKFLCNRYPDHDIVTVGVPSGAYQIGYHLRQYRNFIDKVSPLMNIDTLLLLCEVAVLAIGGTSSLPKISLLQGVPTVIFGHEEERFCGEDNWSNTDVAFYKFDADQYDQVGALAIDYTNKFLQKIINKKGVSA